MGGECWTLRSFFVSSDIDPRNVAVARLFGQLRETSREKSRLVGLSAHREKKARGILLTLRGFLDSSPRIASKPDLNHFSVKS